MTHFHRWGEIENYSNHASLVACACGAKGVAKAKGCGFEAYGYEVREWICWRLVALLAERGARNIHPLHVSFSASSVAFSRYGNTVESGPWGQPAVVIEDIGHHGRLAPESKRYDFPPWLYWFDRLIGRLDGEGDTNLLVIPSGLVVPVDWEFCFPWSIGAAPPIARRVDNMEVGCDPRVVAARDEASRELIKSLTDDEFWGVCVSPEIPSEFITLGRLVSFWSGLCLRRDLL